MHLITLSFFLSSIYYILKSMKDVLIVTSPHSGAEAIPFIKAWGLFPLSIFFAWLFIQYSKRYALSSILKAVIGAYVLFFALFTFVLFPYQETFHLHAFADTLQSYLPPGWVGFTALFRYWIFSLYFILAECWGSMVYCVLFWAIANEMTSFEQGFKFYPLMMLAGNLSAFIAGSLCSWISFNSYSLNFPWGQTAWEQTLISQTLLMMGCGIVAFFTLRPVPFKKPQEIEKTGFLQILPILRKNKYLIALGLMTMAFNLAVNMAEICWKDHLGRRYPDPQDYSAYMNLVTIWIGIISAAMTLLVCTNALQKIGWQMTALLSPLLISIVGVLFLGVQFLGSIEMMTFSATAFVCVMRSCKYSLYDTTKELAYIPLDTGVKLKGKATVDGIFSRFGKGGASLLFQTLLLGFSSISSCLPLVGIIMVIAFGIYIVSVLFIDHSIWHLRQVFAKKTHSPS